MTPPTLNAAAFPAFKRSVRAKWSPVLMEPIVGSFERLVIGVAVVSQDGFHLEMANAPGRLECLYGADAGSLIYAISLAEAHIRDDLARRAVAALTEPVSAISGVTFGPCREAEGESLSAIARSWMAGLSSLYSPDTTSDIALTPPPANDPEDVREAIFGNPLPRQVMEYVIGRRTGFADFFNADIREGKKRRFFGRNHEIHIDFSGSRLVANIAALQPAQMSSSIKLIKWRMWDLKVDRDGAPGLVKGRQHEMLVHRPGRDDPLFTRKQHENVEEALKALEEQADREQLRLRPLDSVHAIGERILEAEAA